MAGNPRVGYHIAASGVDIEQSVIASYGPKFLRINPRTCWVEVQSAQNVFINVKNKKCVVDINDVNAIKEEETGAFLWINSRFKNIIVELDACSRPRLGLAPTPAGLVVLELDKKSFVDESYVEMWNPLFIRFRKGIWMRVKNDQLEIYDGLDGRGADKYEIETFYILHVYEKGGRSIWQKPSQLKSTP